MDLKQAGIDKSSTVADIHDLRLALGVRRQYAVGLFRQLLDFLLAICRWGAQGLCNGPGVCND